MPPCVKGEKARGGMIGAGRGRLVEHIASEIQYGSMKGLGDNLIKANERSTQCGLLCFLFGSKSRSTPGVGLLPGDHRADRGQRRGEPEVHRQVGGAAGAASEGDTWHGGGASDGATGLR